MRIQRVLIFTGIIGSMIFFLQDVLGSVLWNGYNPITMYISQLTADGAPNLQINRFLTHCYQVSLIVFFFGMCYKAFHGYRLWIKLGYIILLAGAFISLFDFSLFPMTVDAVLNMKNTIHWLITITFFLLTVLSIFFLAMGYLKQTREFKIGKISLTTAMLFSAFNLLLLYVVLTGLNIAGLVQRLSIYTFFVFIFILSWNYYFYRKT